MIEQRVSSRYAKALLDSCVNDNIADTIFNDFVVVDGILKNSHELKSFTSSPIIQESKKKQIYNELFDGKLSPLTMSFLLFLLDKKRGELIQSIIHQYNVQYQKLHNRQACEITSAVELSDELKAKVVMKLAEKTNMEIMPEFFVKPDLKGGIIVKVDDWVYDASLTNQLDKLYKKLTALN